MKSTGQKINVIADALNVSGQLVVSGVNGADQIYNPSRNEWVPNRAIDNVVIKAVLSGDDPNTGESVTSISNVTWTINGQQVSVMEGFSAGTNTDGEPILTCTANGTGNTAYIINANISYVNPATGALEEVSASTSLTTTLNDSEQFVLVPTTTQDGLYNPLRGEGGRKTKFGCKLMSGNKQTPAVYQWYVITHDDQGNKIETLVDGSEPWFKGGYQYTYTEDANGVIDQSSWGIEPSVAVNTWGVIDVDLEYAENVNLVAKSGAWWSGESADECTVSDTLQLKYRATREFPLLKKVNMHAIEGYITKPNNDSLEASYFKAYAKVFVGGLEYDGANTDDRSLLEKYYNIVWYKTLNNVKTRIAYGAELNISYEALGVVTSKTNGVTRIDESTIPSIHVEVNENYKAGGIQGSVYSDYTTPNPKAVFGNDSIADELAAYLVENDGTAE